jgi:hypothetical protein
MKRRFLLFLLFIIFLVCLVTFVMVLKYVDPFEYETIGILTLLFTYIFWLSSFLTIILYIIKKVYYRWNVTIEHILTSFRQAFLICIFFLILVFFNYYWAPILITWVLSFIVLFCLELFVKKQD